MFVNTVGNNFVNLNKAEQGDDLKDHFLLSTDSLKNPKKFTFVSFGTFAVDNLGIAHTSSSFCLHLFVILNLRIKALYVFFHDSVGPCFQKKDNHVS